MRFGVCFMGNIDEIGFFSHAESLGFDSVWITDSQMLFSDCYAVLALAAKATTRLRLGPGTAICGTRIPPVHVAGVATINRLAPGRVRRGIGTGNTAMRTMGQRPMRVADYAEYLRVLSALLRGDVVDYTYNGVTRPIQILMHDKEYMNLEPKIPLYVSGFGPRAMELAGEYGDGLVFAIPRRIPQLCAHQHRAARPRRGRHLEPRDSHDRAERDGQRLLLLRRGARAGHRSADLSPAHVEAILRPRREDPARAPALPHPRVPLHVPASGRGRADRRRPDPRHVPGRLRGRADRADPRARAAGLAGAHVRHRRGREVALGR